MNFNEYDGNVKEYTHQVLASRLENPEETKKYCRKIINLGKNDNDSKLLGFAYYYLAEAYFVENEYNKFIKYLILGLEYQHEVPLGGLLARSYNMLGINSDNQGNIPAAIDYYLTSLKYSKEYGLNYETGLANTNIGMIYALLKDYKTAILYLIKALTCFRKGKDNHQISMNEVITETTLATCYYRLGDMESALKYFYKIEKDRDKYLGETHYQLIIYIFEVTFYNALEEYGKRDELIDKLILLVEEIPSLLDMYDEAFTLCEVLIETNRKEDLWRVLVRMEKLSKQAGITNMQLRVLRVKMQYYQNLHNETDYLHACADYYQLSEQLEEENKTVAKKSIELRIDLERVRERQTLIQEENKILLEKSERDSLTKLPNREKLNDYSEIAFERAYINGTSLGIEIFDIDYFKQYNDTYGHQAGDKLLKKIAQLLLNLMEDGIFCARYGGDEFILIYENKTDGKILEIARKLQQDVIALNFKNNNTTADPVVTISQGIRNSIPHKGNKIWDYFYVADMAMYQVKRAKKNDISLVHKAVAPVENI
jgi:diguanylate cyclase (GGDEF)-like protein